MIQSFGIFNGNNFLESFLSRVFQLSSNLSYVAAPGTAWHCYVETVTQPAHNKLSTACPKFAPCKLYPAVQCSSVAVVVTRHQDQNHRNISTLLLNCCKVEVDRTHDT